MPKDILFSTVSLKFCTLQKSSTYSVVGVLTVRLLNSTTSRVNYTLSKSLLYYLLYDIHLIICLSIPCSVLRLNIKI